VACVVSAAFVIDFVILIVRARINRHGLLIDETTREKGMDGSIQGALARVFGSIDEMSRTTNNARVGEMKLTKSKVFQSAAYIET
jgi:hypothetical protein